MAGRSLQASAEGIQIIRKAIKRDGWKQEELKDEHVNILEKITGRKRRELPELLQNASQGEFDRFGLGNVKEECVPGLMAAPA